MVVVFNRTMNDIDWLIEGDGEAVPEENGVADSTEDPKPAAEAVRNTVSWKFQGCIKFPSTWYSSPIGSWDLHPQVKTLPETLLWLHNVHCTSTSIFSILIFFPNISVPIPSSPVDILLNSLNVIGKKILLSLISLFFHVIFFPTPFIFPSPLHNLIFFHNRLDKLNKELFTLL